MMLKKCCIAYFMSMLICLSANATAIKSEFNVREYWYDGMPWDEFNEIKVKLERPELIKYVDKIEQQKMAKEVGLEVPETYIATREKVPLVDLLATLPENYVVKATHMSWGDGLIIVKDGINMMTDQPISLQEIEEQIHNALDAQAREGQPWALCNVPPGLMIQEYIPYRSEAKVITVFGKMIIGDWRRGETQYAVPPSLGRFDRNGNLVQGWREAPDWWPKVVEAAERMAQGTDALRVDFLVRDNGEILLNELEIYPEMSWLNSTKAALSAAVSEGYRNLKSE